MLRIQRGTYRSPNPSKVKNTIASLGFRSSFQLDRHGFLRALSREVCRSHNTVDRSSGAIAPPYPLSGKRSPHSVATLTRILKFSGSAIVGIDRPFYRYDAMGEKAIEGSARAARDRSGKSDPIPPFHPTPITFSEVESPLTDAIALFHLTVFSKATRFSVERPI
jgi:hypothetical protein